MLWMVLNLVLMALMIPGDAEDLNNYVEVVLWVSSLVGLWLMKRWGAALAVTTLGVTLGTSMGNVFMAYYLDMLGELFAPVNALRIVVNVVAVVYLFRCLFRGVFR
jgi:uncharacterized membrane protein (DUF2068 family)